MGLFDRGSKTRLRQKRIRLDMKYSMRLGISIRL